MYIARHDRIVDLIVKDISSNYSSSVKMYKDSCVKPSMFQNCNSSEAFSHVSANTPDVVVVNEEISEVFIVEVACTFDYSMEEAFMTKIIKYQPLLNIISELGYQRRILVFIFGSLGHTHRLVVRGLQQLGMPKKRAKRLVMLNIVKICCVCDVFDCIYSIYVPVNRVF